MNTKTHVHISDEVVILMTDMDEDEKGDTPGTAGIYGRGWTARDDQESDLSYRHVDDTHTLSISMTMSMTNT